MHERPHTTVHTLTFGRSQPVDVCILITQYQRYKYQCDATLMQAVGILSLHAVEAERGREGWTVSQDNNEEGKGEEALMASSSSRSENDIIASSG